MSTREKLESTQKNTVRAFLPFQPLGSGLEELESGLEEVRQRLQAWCSGLS